MDKEKPKIFLSYAREDMGMAKQLYNDLKRYGLDVWLDTESLLPGDRWKDKIQDAIENSNYFIALLSTRSVNKKGFVQKELKTALEVLDLFPSSELFILPVRLDDCEVCERKLKEHHWVDLFHENEYKNGLKKIIMVVSPNTFILRKKPKEISFIDVNEMIKTHDFYDRDRNPNGNGIEHNYKIREYKNDNVIFDEATGLFWQQKGSKGLLTLNQAKKWITGINKKSYSGFIDWRLPTLEEAMSLIVPERKNYQYINPIFNSRQDWIWTSDLVKGESQLWVVCFSLGYCNWDYLESCYHVRAVRSGQPSQEKFEK